MTPAVLLRKSETAGVCICLFCCIKSGINSFHLQPQISQIALKLQKLCLNSLWFCGFNHYVSNRVFQLNHLHKPLPAQALEAIFRLPALPLTTPAQGHNKALCIYRQEGRKFVNGNGISKCPYDDSGLVCIFVPYGIHAIMVNNIVSGKEWLTVNL
jgi:hypothetical protein